MNLPPMVDVGKGPDQLRALGCLIVPSVLALVLVTVVGLQFGFSFGASVFGAVVIVLLIIGLRFIVRGE